jgi:hypothetical protein
MLFICSVSAQEQKQKQSILILTNKPTSKSGTKILNFIMQADTSFIESIQIYGYCDDRGYVTITTNYLKSV